VIIANVQPTVGTITAPPVPVKTAINASANFTDPGILDTHTAVWNWGDGASSPGVVTEINGSGSVAGSHTYIAAGIYTVTLTVTDKDGGLGRSTYESVVVYNPNGVLIGSGSIKSPVGAYKANPKLTGMANFGFVAKYNRGATIPAGATEFHFSMGNLNFYATSYQWLVVTGARAQCKGTGSINGTGNYGFMLTVIDGQVKGGGGLDKFRIKITLGSNVIYDNQMGAPDSANPTTAVAGFNIVVRQ
jgi:PKD repeat protein